MINDVVISGLNTGETYPGLDDLIQEVKCKFGISKTIEVIISDDPSSGLNMNIENKFGLRGDPNTLDNVLIITRGMFKIFDITKNTDEMKILIAHECSHLKNEDVSVSNNIIVIYAALAVIFAEIVAVLSSCNFILIFLALVITAICYKRNHNWKRRLMETRADREAVIEMGTPDALQIALKKTYIEKMHNPNNLRFAALYSVYDFIVGSPYPSHIERINNIEVWKLPK
jgi:Zn-dependent protease with chaperone function